MWGLQILFLTKQDLKWIVHSKNENVMFICLPQGHPRWRWLSFFSRTQTKIFNSNRCSLSVIWCQSMGHTEKTCRDKTKSNPAARDDTLRSKDTKRSVCARNWTVFISFVYLWSATRSNYPEHVHTTAGDASSCFMVDRRLHITTTYLSNGPLTLNIYNLY